MLNARKYCLNVTYYKNNSMDNKTNSAVLLMLLLLLLWAASVVGGDVDVVSWLLQLMPWIDNYIYNISVDIL